MPYSDPEKRKEFSLRWQRENRDRRNAIVTRYREKTKRIAFRNSDARRRYGFDSYEHLKSYRDRPCEICGVKAGKMCIDHHGPAGVFDQTHRGVLCQQCNTRLGWFERNREVIVEYLKREPRNASQK